ncbi:hypothetical protein SDC9_187259 [bioreactor metagenome]|uniref:Uncharacterized protein n=1 Tax=bioreactor metagenome TaxID=1076179 RepID=A0A645HLR8_9ZZZZ
MIDQSQRIAQVAVVVDADLANDVDRLVRTDEALADLAKSRADLGHCSLLFTALRGCPAADVALLVRPR